MTIAYTSPKSQDPTTIEPGVVNLRAFNLRDGYYPTPADTPDTPDWLWSSARPDHSCATIPTLKDAEAMLSEHGFISCPDPKNAHAYHVDGVGLCPTYSGGEHRWWVNGTLAIVAIWDL